MDQAYVKGRLEVYHSGLSRCRGQLLHCPCLSIYVSPQKSFLTPQPKANNPTGPSSPLSSSTFGLSSWSSSSPRYFSTSVTIPLRSSVSSSASAGLGFSSAVITSLKVPASAASQEAISSKAIYSHWWAPLFTA